MDTIQSIYMVLTVFTFALTLLGIAIAATIIIAVALKEYRREQKRNERTKIRTKELEAEIAEIRASFNNN